MAAVETPAISVAASSGLMSTDEAATYLCAKPRTLEIWRHQKRGPTYVKLGGHVRYRLGDLDAYIESRLRTAVAA